MIIYKDIISGDELFTDSSKMIKNNGIIEIEAKKITESTDVDDSLIGGNASAEEASEGNEASATTGYDVALQNRLVEMPTFDKKAYMAHIKGYLKNIKTKLVENGKSEDDIKLFESQAKDYVKKVTKNIGEMEVFCGESMDGDAMQVLVDYREDGVTAFFQFFEAGLIEEKV